MGRIVIADGIEVDEEFAYWQTFKKPVIINGKKIHGKWHLKAEEKYRTAALAPPKDKDFTFQPDEYAAQYWNRVNKLQEEIDRGFEVPKRIDGMIRLPVHDELIQYKGKWYRKTDMRQTEHGKWQKGVGRTKYRRLGRWIPKYTPGGWYNYNGIMLPKQIQKK